MLGGEGQTETGSGLSLLIDDVLLCREGSCPYDCVCDKPNFSHVALVMPRERKQ